ncbi:hypothetical protein F511_27531 [Dorcoceras hygrometricum]|uniref:Uncharacterized protein n=1 Tax=Dorcoceras hygrometricum TaxID=472368 RepID=A0A2Z7A715_9LAMI|nr:hypothetical protein F511_27531 [Dorcoceras hygrometricum]
MGNTDPNKTKAGNKYEVKPQYEELSKQILNKDTSRNNSSLLTLKLPRQIPFKIPRSLNLPKIPNILAQTNERKLTQRIETHGALTAQFSRFAFSLQLNTASKIGRKIKVFSRGFQRYQELEKRRSESTANRDRK